MPPARSAKHLPPPPGDDVDWQAGRGWSLASDSPAWHAELVDQASTRFSDRNAPPRFAFPSAGAFEEQTISIACSLSPGKAGPMGVFTTGGTESIMVAVKGYRASSQTPAARYWRPSPPTPSFWKAADYLGLDLRRLPVGADGLQDVEEMVAAMDETTTLVGLSAPCLPRA